MQRNLSAKHQIDMMAAQAVEEAAHRASMTEALHRNADVLQQGMNVMEKGTLMLGEAMRDLVSLMKNNMQQRQRQHYRQHQNRQQPHHYHQPLQTEKGNAPLPAKQV